jgi:hypothetical protein
MWRADDYRVQIASEELEVIGTREGDRMQLREPFGSAEFRVAEPDDLCLWIAL